MFELIAHLRRQPPERRRRVAFLLALLVTLLIFALWFVSLLFGGRGSRTETPAPATTPAEGLWLQTKAGIRAFTQSLRH